MPGGYSTQRDYMATVQAEADTREDMLLTALRDAFSPFVEKREVEVVLFSGMSAFELARAILAQPIVLKSLLACCNIAGRALERDLDIKNLDTYAPRLTDAQAQVIAGYIKPFLPPYLELPTLARIDRVWYIDKEIRKGKGRWERRILEALNRNSTLCFRKRKFQTGGESFEIDAASPEKGAIDVGVDVKRIEARRDIHKRCNEIVNKASKFKQTYPDSRFGAVVYYPFIDEHTNIQSRLRTNTVGAVVFANDSDASIDNAVKLLLATLEVGK